MMTDNVAPAEGGYWHESPPVPFNGLTIDFFIEEARKAHQLGCTHWGTSTDKSETPWKTTLIFYKPQKGLKR